MSKMCSVGPATAAGALTLLASSAAFGGFVAPGSQYDINLAKGFPVVASPVITFDGVDEMFTTTTNVDVIVSESEVPLGDGSALITIRVLGDEPIFPDNSSPVFWSVGRADPLDLVGAVEVLSATYTILDASGAPVGGALPQGIDGPNPPWGGATNLSGTPAPSDTWAGWEWRFTVIPSPGAGALAMVGVAALGRRRR